MKALVKERPGPGISLREVPDPSPAPGEVVVRVGACGVDGSDVGRYRWDAIYRVGGPKDMSRLLPRILGHEFSGDVVALGEGVDVPAIGQRVAVNNVVGCGRCEECWLGSPNVCRSRVTIGVDRDGGLAEYCALPAPNALSLPAEVSVEVGAFLQPFAIGTHAVDVAALRAGDRVGVWGAGAVGLSVLLNAQLAGAEVAFVVGRGRRRLEVARRLGAARTLSVLDGKVGPRLLEELGPDSLDALFEASGSPEVFPAGVPLLRPRGRLLLIGNFSGPVTADLVGPKLKEIAILGVRTFSPLSWRRAAGLIGKTRAGEVLGPTFPLSRGEEAFRLAAEGGGVKVMVKPD